MWLANEKPAWVDLEDHHRKYIRWVEFDCLEFFDEWDCSLQYVLSKGLSYQSHRHLVVINQIWVGWFWTTALCAKDARFFYELQKIEWDNRKILHPSWIGLYCFRNFRVATPTMCESINSRTFSNANDLLSVCCFFLQTLALISHLMALAIDMSVEPWRRIEIWFLRWLKYWPEYKYEVSRPHLKRNEKKTTSACLTTGL